MTGFSVVSIAPHADDNSNATMLPTRRSIVSCDNVSEESAIAIAPHIPDNAAASMTHVRRSRPLSTTGDHRKYQKLGIDEIATTLAIRSGDTPRLRSRNGMSVMTMPLNMPYGIERIPNNHGGFSREAAISRFLILTVGRDRG